MCQIECVRFNQIDYHRFKDVRLIIILNHLNKLILIIRRFLYIFGKQLPLKLFITICSQYD